MSDGMDLDLQRAIFLRLAADSLVRQLIGHPVRIYQLVPENPQFPYVVIGRTQMIDDSVEHLDAADVFVTLDVWSDSVAKDFRECKRICSALRRSLHNADLVLAQVGNRCVSIEHRGTTVLRDADGVTVHGVVEFVAQTEEGLNEAEDMGIQPPTGGLGVTGN